MNTIPTYTRSEIDAIHNAKNPLENELFQKIYRKNMGNVVFLPDAEKKIGKDEYGSIDIWGPTYERPATHLICFNENPVVNEYLNRVLWTIGSRDLRNLKKRKLPLPVEIERIGFDGKFEDQEINPYRKPVAFMNKKGSLSVFQGYPGYFSKSIRGVLDFEKIGFDESGKIFTIEHKQNMQTQLELARPFDIYMVAYVDRIRKNAAEVGIEFENIPEILPVDDQE